MKKIFTLVAVAMMALSSFADTPLVIGGGWNGGFSPIAADDAVFDYQLNSQWTAATFELNEAGYTKCLLEFAEPLPANFQINYKTDAAENPDRYNVVAAAGETSAEVIFREGDDFIVNVSIQHTDAESAELHVKKAKFVKADGSEKIVTPSLSSWGSVDLTKNYAGTVSLPSQYMQLQISGATGMKDIEVRVEFAEPFTGGLQFCLDYEGDVHEWPQMVRGEKVQTVKTTKEGLALTNLGIQRQEAGDMTVTVLGAWLVETETGVSNIVSIPTTGVKYNIAGQRVNNNAKGLIIVDGKKYFNK